METMNVSDLLEKLRPGMKTVIDVAGKEGDRKLTVEFRRLLAEEPREPKRAESPSRKHELLSAQSLATYLLGLGEAHELDGKLVVIFADPRSETIHAVLDDAARDGFEAVVMKPAPHPLWLPWAKIVGRPMPIETFAQFMIEHRKIVEDGLELARDLSQVRANVSVEIHRGKGKDAINGVLVRSKIQSEAGRAEAVDLPNEIFLNVPLYLQTDAVRVELDLTLDADAEGEVTVLVSASGVEVARVEAFTRMVETISEATKGRGFTVVYGAPGYAPWAYLPEFQPEATK